MILTFQVSYTLPGSDQVHQTHMEAETSGEAEAAVRGLFVGKSLVVHVGPGRNPQLDAVRWERIGLTHLEAAYALTISADTLTRMKAKGEFPKSNGQIGQVPLRVIEQANLSRFGLKSWEEAA